MCYFANFGGQNVKHSDFAIKKTRRDWIVIRKEYQWHSHHSTEQGCQKLIDMLIKNKMPRSEYLKESAKRLTTEDEYSGLKLGKQNYVNRRY